MAAIIGSPTRYIQGKGEMKNLCSYADKFGKNLFILTSASGRKRVEPAINEGNKDSNLVYDVFNGECCMTEINRIIKIVEEAGSDVIIGIGGGKIHDTSKAVAYYTKKPVIIVPTIASTDAPCSALSVIYTDEGAFERYIFYSKNPELVLVDSKVISQAPKRLLASGIADGLATWVEARAVMQANGKTMLGKHQTLAGVAIAERCEEILFADGLQAMAACEAKVVTPALENIIEANTLLSGIGFESGGLAAAHAIHNGFTALTGDIHHLTHGEKVAYGTLVQLFLENRPKEELNKYIRFYQQIGMPTTLKEMHLENASYEDLLKVGQQATIEGETIHQMPFEVKASDIAQAIVAVDAYVHGLA